MTKVRTTFTPDVVTDVGDSEFLDLSRQGLISSHERLDKESGLVPVAGRGRWKDGDAVAVESGVVTDTQAVPAATEGKSA
jgi:hypothetical protein